MTAFTSALIFPQWQGAGARKGYAAGTALLETLIPDDLPRAWVACADSEIMARDGVKGLDDIVAQAETAQHLLGHLPPGPVLTLGGDCAADLIPIHHALQVCDGDMALLYIDAHADLNSAAESPSGHFHGMVVRTLLGDGPVPLTNLLSTRLRPDQLFFVSARERDSGEDAAMVRCGLYRHADDAPLAALQRDLHGRGFPRLYIHLDLDVLDPIAFPHIGVPASDGWPLERLIACLGMLRASFDIVGAAITELNLAQAEAAAEARTSLQCILADGFGLRDSLSGSAG